MWINGLFFPVKAPLLFEIKETKNKYCPAAVNVRFRKSLAQFVKNETICTTT